MGKMGQSGVLLAGLIGLCELVALQSAFAQPPRQKVTAALSHGSKGQERDPPRLDLRAPSQVLSGYQANATSAAPTDRRLFGGESPFRSDTQPNSEQSGHIMSPLQNMAHNYQREGLPLAKLFQNGNSLVHVGLNPRGKPGLWIVHKLH
jgi:hypothetical protein